MIKGQILTDAASEVQRKFYFVELKNKKEDYRFTIKTALPFLIGPFHAQ